jgi:sulfur carrier protein ThiS
MKVRVKLFGRLQDRCMEYDRVDGLVIEVREGITVNGLLNHLEIPPSAGVIVITEGTVLAGTDQVRADSEIGILQPIYGG